ncbi:MAG: hypothetical protein J7K21_02175 [Desulfurococcales archaeon]|nr:hypothetical protein [Desulfurococcales archaeon]
MCRLTAFSVTREGIGIAFKVLDALIEAASNDHYLIDLGRDGKHCDGWGFVVLADMDGWRICYNRGYVGDSNSSSCTENLKGLAETVDHVKQMISSARRSTVIVHARKAGRREPLGLFHTHPYSYVLTTNSKHENLFFAHNGGVRKRDILKELGIENEELYTDSYTALLYIAHKLSHEEDLVKTLTYIAKTYTKKSSGFNTALLRIKVDGEPLENNALLYIIGYIHPDADKKLRKYYEPLLFTGNGIVGYMSSTMRDILSRNKSLDLEYITIDHYVIGVNVNAEIVFKNHMDSL